MINIASFTNKKIIALNGNLFWEFSDIQNVHKEVSFSFNIIKEIQPNFYIAHIDSADISDILKYREDTQFTSLKEIQSTDELTQSLINSIKEYYIDATFNFSVIKPSEIGKHINTQVFGFCINAQNEFCIVRDQGEENWTLPGGGCEFGETAIDAFKREVREEAQMSIKDITVLCYVKVTVTKQDKVIEEIIQARLASHTDVIDEFMAGKDGFETAERKFVTFSDLPSYIDWLNFDSGKDILKLLASYV